MRGAETEGFVPFMNSSETRIHVDESSWASRVRVCGMSSSVFFRLETGPRASSTVLSGLGRFISSAPWSQGKRTPRMSEGQRLLPECPNLSELTSQMSRRDGFAFVKANGARLARHVPASCAGRKRRPYRAGAVCHGVSVSAPSAAWNSSVRLHR